MVFIKVDGVELPAPSGYEIVKRDIDGADRSVSEIGILHRNIVRNDVYSLEINWLVSEEQLKEIFSVLSKDSFTVEFLEPSSDSEKNCLMYTRERSFSCIGIDGGVSWWRLAVCLAEY